MTTQATAQQLTLKYVKTIGIVNNGFNGRGFGNPVDLAVGEDARIFVLNRCDPARKTAIRVGVCNLDDDYLYEFGNGYGDGDGQFILPVAMAFDAQQRLHITDEYNDRVSVFDASGEFLYKWGSHGEGDGELNGPAGIAFDSEGSAYVADQNNHRVQKYAPDGDYQLGWGEPGDGPGQLNMPWGLTVDAGGKVYVADWRNDRIQVFTASGEHLASYGESGDGDGQFSRPSDVAVDGDGNIYVADWGNERVQVLGPDGEFLLNLLGQATVSKWAEDFFASNPDEVVERDKSNLLPELPSHLDTAYHVSSQTEPYFWGPIAVTLDGEGRLYVTESNRHRFQVYQTGSG